MASNVPGVCDVTRPFAQCAEPGLSWRVPSESFRERSVYTMLNAVPHLQKICRSHDGEGINNKNFNLTSFF